MNQPLLLHIVERLESLLGKLPPTIQKPILSELTPLKELFLQQRPPRFILAGSVSKPTNELIASLFGQAEPSTDVTSIFRWQEITIGDRGTIAILDARGAGREAEKEIREELKRHDADLILFITENDGSRHGRKAETDDLLTWLDWSAARMVVVSFSTGKSTKSGSDTDKALSHLQTENARVLDVIDFGSAESASSASKRLLRLLARELPNPARIEMIRISQDRQGQRDVAQILIKSTTAICAAIGTQPIPLADLPILTTLQLVMVSGIMYISGRERSLRAATEFIAALGANVGAGMLFREGARALLKLVPGWGNIICGMIAGAGTYAIGHAATAFFLEGVSLKQARQAYLKSRRKRHQPALGNRKVEKARSR